MIMRAALCLAAVAACESGAPAPAVAPGTRRLPAVTYDGEIGTAHPTKVVEAARNGRWVVAKQARADTDGYDGIRVTVGEHGVLRGDAMRAYLFRGAGPGVAIDQLLAWSRDDRWLVVDHDHRRWLIDDLAGTETGLDVDERALGVLAQVLPIQMWSERAMSRLDRDDRDVFFLTDDAGRRTRALPRLLEPATELEVESHEAGAFVSLGSALIDARTSEVIGEWPRVPVAIDAAGRGLIGTSAVEHGLVRGPLHWERARVGAPPLPPAQAWTIDGAVVDDAGRPVAGATVTISEAEHRTPATEHDPHARWGRSEQFIVGTTDRAGTFRWAPEADHGYHGEAAWPVAQAVMVIAPDGRMGAADAIEPDASPVTIAVHAPGALRIACVGRMRGRWISVRSGQRTQPASCGETISALPSGHYAVIPACESDCTITEVDVRPGATTIATVRPPAGVTAITGQIVEYPGDTPAPRETSVPPPPLRCLAELAASEGDAGTSVVYETADGQLTAPRAPDGRVRLRCRGGEVFTGGEAEVVATHATVRVARRVHDAEPIGVRFSLVPDGARLLVVGLRAARAGLAVGDIVQAVNDIPLAGAGLGRAAFEELAFRVRPQAAVRWRIQRAGEVRTIASPSW